jgi:hypothetical protein
MAENQDISKNRRCRQKPLLTCGFAQALVAFECLGGQNQLSVQS